MKYSLRSLMIVVAVLPPLLAVGWWGVLSVVAPAERAEVDYGPGPPGQLGKALAEYEKYERNNP